MVLITSITDIDVQLNSNCVFHFIETSNMQE